MALRNKRKRFNLARAALLKMEKLAVEKRLRPQMKELIMYLTIHDKPLAVKALRIQQSHTEFGDEMRRDLRKLIGQTHWRRYLAYYNHFRKTGERIKIELTDAHTKTAPPFPTISPSLDADVTSYIFSFLDGKDMHEASKVSREYRDALIPRQRNITFEGFRSIASFKQMNFIGAVYFSGGPKLIDYDTLPTIVEDFLTLPNLAHISMENCDMRNDSDGQLRCVEAMGPRLETFEDYNGTLAGRAIHDSDEEGMLRYFDDFCRSKGIVL